MKISPVSSSNSNFKGGLNNKALLKSLEFISDHGASFVAGTTLLMSSVVRPVAIAASPDVDKENKEYAVTNSIASGLVKFAAAEALAIPVENAIKKIDKTPDKFLKPETVSVLKAESENILNSKKYKSATQLIKQSTGLLSAIPKTMITIALIPVLMHKFFKDNDKRKQTLVNSKSKVFEPIQPSFKGNGADVAVKSISGILNNKSYLNFVDKLKSNEDNIARNMSVATDLLLTASFVKQTKDSKKIKEERKKPLIYNSLISTGITLTLGVGADKMIRKNTQKYIDKFKSANKNDLKLAKYIDGINILRPTIIFAAVYYGIMPVISTTLADRIDKFEKSRNKNKDNTKYTC